MPPSLFANSFYQSGLCNSVITKSIKMIQNSDSLQLQLTSQLFILKLLNIQTIIQHPSSPTPKPNLYPWQGCQICTETEPDLKKLKSIVLRSVSVHFGSPSPDLSHLGPIWPNLDTKFDIPVDHGTCDLILPVMTGFGHNWPRLASNGQIWDF